MFITLLHFTLTIPILLIHRSRVEVHGLLVVLLLVHEVDCSPFPPGCAGGSSVGGVAEGGGAHGGGRGRGRDEK